MYAEEFRKAMTNNLGATFKLGEPDAKWKLDQNTYFIRLNVI